MKIITFLFILATFLAQVACSDLKEDTTQVTTFEQYFQTEEQVRNFILPVYQGLHPEAYFHVFAMPDAVVSDEAASPSQGNFGLYFWLNLQRHLLNSIMYENQLLNTWNYLYVQIEQCNQRIELLKTSSFPAVTAPYLAELKVYRAFFYLQLIDKFGNVPIRDENNFRTESICTNPRSEVFGFIEKSLLESVPFLSKTTGGEMHGRMNFYTAQAMLAKLYLNAEVYRGTPAWSEALAACDAIILSGALSLSANYFDNFKINSKGSPENILTASCLFENCNWFSPYIWSLHGAHLSILSGQFIPYWGNYLVVQPDFFARYDSLDTRIQSFFIGPQFDTAGNPILDQDAEPSDPDGAPINYTPEINLDFPLRQAGIRFAKFEIEKNCPSLFGCQLSTHEYPIFRYADILLMKAEALLRLNANADEALALVNAVRERSGAEPFGDLSLETLLDERGRELFMEGWRRSDLIRFGRFNDAWWEKEADASAHVNLFPIPGYAIQGNPCLMQNPGY